jgi:predicted acylesterase/phospholipase RssA
MLLLVIWIVAVFTGFVVSGTWLVRKLMRRRRSWLSAGVAVAFAGYVVSSVSMCLWDHPWSGDAQWANAGALAALSPLSERRFDWDWTAERLAERLQHKDRLVLVALSGGGSRAAYFDAAILEQLGKIKVPGSNGRPVSLVQRIDVLSTISGGSIAGAYFAAYRPESEEASDAELATFFKRFKQAMATDFEFHMASDLISVRHWVPFVLGLRNPADALGDVLDRRIFGGNGFPYKTLLEREKRGGPLLIVNATILGSFGLLAFTPDSVMSTPLYRVTQRPEANGLSPEALSTQDYRFTPDLTSFGDGYGDLAAFRVADAVAASASYPLLGTFQLHDPVNASAPTMVLADGGLVDNSGLLSLYAHVFRRSVFKAAEGRLKGLVIIAIDAGGAGGFSMWPLNIAFGIYEQAQKNVQRFVLPEMIRRAAEQDLADLLARPAWAGFELPRPFVFDYDLCHVNEPPIPTRLRISAAERASLDKAAESCASGANAVLTARVTGAAPRMPPPYTGIFGPSDLSAWRTLFRLAQAERSWQQMHGRWATIGEVVAGKMDVDHPREGHYTAKLDFGAEELLPQRTGFVFESEISGNELRLYATPVTYKSTGWVSLVVTVEPDKPVPMAKVGPTAAAGSHQDPLDDLIAMEREIEKERAAREFRDMRFCMDLPRNFHGGDLGGKHASPEDAIFTPYGFHTYEMCI